MHQKLDGFCLFRHAAAAAAAGESFFMLRRVVLARLFCLFVGDGDLGFWMLKGETGGELDVRR